MVTSVDEKPRPSQRAEAHAETGVGHVGPARPRPIDPEDVETRFVRGREHPRGVVWFGVRSFWGHLRHFVASAIATEDVDSRDWMTADPPHAMVARVAEALGARHSAPTLVESLGRDLWIDYLADTGDDTAVSRAVARLVFAEYELPDPRRPGEHVSTPRGDILLFGGDTAYPVATAQEITNRVLVPFNQILEASPTGAPHVLLGIPGNHDWYDGLDGFGRMFRRHIEAEEELRPSVIGISQRMLEHYAEWARQFMRGGRVEKPRTLVLSGYTAVQAASYFVLPLTPTLHLCGVDRQLRDVDSRQVQFFTSWFRKNPEVCPWVMLPDPVYHFGEPSRTGTAMIRALELDFEQKPHFMLSGDVHHYRRTQDGKTLHVIAGGGGAFLHPAPMLKTTRLRVDAQWPSLRQSHRLLWQVPWKVMLGRSGILPHLVLGILFLPSVFLAEHALALSLPGSFVFAIGAFVVFALLGSVRRRGRRVIAPAAAAGIIIAALPVVVSRLVVDLIDTSWITKLVAWLLCVYAGSFVFGLYLAVLTRLGIEHTQAFTALDHPGFKHFLRLRVRADGSGVDFWCLGLVDPLRENAEPVLVDASSFELGD
jgi:hypothetical protein